MYDILELNKKLLTELREIAKGLQIKRVEAMKKQDIIYKILDQQAITSVSPKKQEPKKVLVASSSPSTDEVKDKPKLRERIKLRDPELPKDTEQVVEKQETDEKRRNFPRIKFFEKKAFIKKEDLVDTDALNITSNNDEDDFPVVAASETEPESGVEVQTTEVRTTEPNIEDQIRINTGFDIKIDKDFHLRKPMEKKVPEKTYEFDGIITSAGVLEIMPDGYGFLRSAD